MTTTALEREVKLDVDDGWAVPDLTGLPGVAAVVDAGRHRLVATYHDTADHRLLAARATLRRRTGGHDAGWHLKLPAGPDGARLEVRREHRRPPRAVPPALVQAVTARTRGAQLHPVMELVTVRRAVHLMAADGTVLAELADDQVTAQAPGDAPAQSWREVEVELVEGDLALLDAAVAALLGSGARPAGGPSKLGRALGAPTAGRAPIRAPRSTGGLLLGYLRAQVDALVDADARVRLDAAEGVHDLRVATRRLRSTLATHRRRLPDPVVADLRARLRRLAERAAAARDAEVLLARLPAELEALPAELRSRRTERQLVAELTTDLTRARTDLLAALGEPEYLTLLDALAALVAGGRLPRPRRRRPAPGRRASVRHELRRVRRALSAARRARRTDRVAPALHELRKAAKRARYAAEVVAPRVGGRAERFAERMAAVQDLLGAHQDDVVAAARLGVLVATAREDGMDPTAVGALAQRLGHPDDAVLRLARRSVERAGRHWPA